MPSGVVKGSDTHLLLQQLDHFYRRNEQKKKKDGGGEFAIESLYGKRSQKELEFIQKMGDLNRKDLELNKQLAGLNDRWSKGVGMGKKFVKQQLGKPGRSPRGAKGTKVVMFKAKERVKTGDDLGSPAPSQRSGEPPSPSLYINSASP